MPQFVAEDTHTHELSIMVKLVSNKERIEVCAFYIFFNVLLLWPDIVLVKRVVWVFGSLSATCIEQADKLYLA